MKLNSLFGKKLPKRTLSKIKDAALDFSKTALLTND
jgi:hypothetical protein